MSKNNNLREVTTIIGGSFIIAVLFFLFQSGYVSSLVNNTTQALTKWYTKDVPADSEVATGSASGTAVVVNETFIDAEPPPHLIYLTTTHPANSNQSYDLYIGEDRQNNLKLLHYKRRNYRATTTYPVHRAYPGNISADKIIADFISGDGDKVFDQWFGKQPAAFSLAKTTGLLSTNLITRTSNGKVILPEWLEVPPDCISYMGGDDCVFTIKNPNPYNLPASTLTQTTGPHKWSRMVSPYEIYVTNDKKILIRWVFGDAGVHSQTNSVWDPTTNTITKISTIGGQGQDVAGRGQVTLSVLDKSYKHTYPENTVDEASPILEQEPFSGWSVYGEPLENSCYNLNFYPTDLTSATAPWLVEYRYGCSGERFLNLSAWYELNPNTDSLHALTGVMPR